MPSASPVSRHRFVGGKPCGQEHRKSKRTFAPAMDLNASLLDLRPQLNRNNSLCGAAFIMLDGLIKQPGNLPVPTIRYSQLPQFLVGTCPDQAAAGRRDDPVVPFANTQSTGSNSDFELHRQYGACPSPSTAEGMC